MVVKVTQYLQDVLAPTLNHFHVPAAYARQIIDTVELQMTSFLRHWDDLAFRRTLLLLGSEEGPFYEPAGKAEVFQSKPAVRFKPTVRMNFNKRGLSPK